MGTTHQNDPFQAKGGLERPVEHLFAITKSDTVLFAVATRAIYVGGAGDIAILPVGQDTATTLVGVQAGTVLPIRAARVNSTGTTATNMVGLY